MITAKQFIELTEGGKKLLINRDHIMTICEWESKTIIKLVSGYIDVTESIAEVERRLKEVIIHAS